MKQTALRSGESHWRANGPAPIECSPFEGSGRCEVAVVGTGITGTLIGYQLSKAGVDVILCDKGVVGAGSTAASTGLLQYEVDKPLVELIDAVGEVHAVHAYRRGQQAIDELEILASQIDPGNRCGFSRRATLCLASTEDDLPDLHREYDCRSSFGFDVSFLERPALREFGGFAEPGGLLSAGDAQVDPYRLTQSLIRAAQANGLRAFSDVNILAIKERPPGVHLRTASGSIEARSAVLATGYFPNPCAPERLARLQTTYVAVSEPFSAAPEWPGGCLIWETARPYFYARTTSDGRAMIGGEDTPFAGDHQDADLLTAKADRLRIRFERLFAGAAFEPAYAWAGTFAETADGLPFIGRPSGSEHIYLALGYGGNGITFSTIAARLISDLIVGRPNADEAVFHFERPSA